MPTAIRHGHTRGAELAWGRAVVALACLLTAAPGRSAPGSDAPLQVGTEGTFETLFLEITLTDARVRTRPELQLGWSLANDWSIPTHLIRGDQAVLLRSDEQADSLSMSVWVPWSRLGGSGPEWGGRPLWERLSSSLELKVTEHWGGWTDGIIEHWHRLIGSFGFERGSYPRNRVNLALMDEKTGRGVLINSSRFAVGDVVTRTQLLLVEGGVSEVTPDRARAALSIRFDLKAPVGSPSRLGGSGGWDVGLAMIGTVELARWVTLHALVGVAYFSAIALPEPLQPVPWHLTVELSLPFRVGPVTLLLEDRVTSTLFQGGWHLPPKTGDADVLSSGYYGAFRPQNQVSGGVRWGPVTWWFSEDWTPGSNPHSDRGWFYNSNTPDIATGLTVSLML